MEANACICESIEYLEKSLERGLEFYAEGNCSRLLTMDPKCEAHGCTMNASETEGNEQLVSLYSFTV
jgi:hypothetical protein